jgi:hypothetical protein
MKPSDIINIFPYSSVTKDARYEIVAMNIVIILKRTGDKFRLLSFKEYIRERKKDKNGNPENEKVLFDKVINYFKTEDTVRLFCECWNI